MSVSVLIQRLPHGPETPPQYASDGAAGVDLLLAGDSVALEPGQRALVPTGIQVAIPQGFEGQIRLRSGFARRTGCILPNAPGTIDSDYRGELLVLLMNVSHERVVVEQGERFAQLVLAPVARIEWSEVETLPESSRGAGGFGSTGR